ncbi:hypothetical protein J6590_023111 [Homalodisca vitripennis]|nr:hypothetical protein J6590_023111 [Homalodisca vitripennis]
MSFKIVLTEVKSRRLPLPALKRLKMRFKNITVYRYSRQCVSDRYVGYTVYVRIRLCEFFTPWPERCGTGTGKKWTSNDSCVGLDVRTVTVTRIRSIYRARTGQSETSYATVIYLQPLLAQIETSKRMPERPQSTLYTTSDRPQSTLYTTSYL